MSHGITANDRFLSSESAEWHNLCIVKDRNLPFSEWYDDAFPWADSVYQTGVMTQRSPMVLPNRFVLMRGDINQPISDIYSSYYCPVSPKRGHPFSFEDICRRVFVNEGIGLPSSLGSTDSGCNLIASFHLPSEYSLPGDRPNEKIPLVASLINRMGESLKLIVSGTRPICNNTITFALNEARAKGSCVSVSHTGHFFGKLSAAKNVLGLTSANLDRNINAILALQSKTLTPSAAYHFTMELNPKQPDPQRSDYPDTEDGQQKFDAAVSRINSSNRRLIKVNTAALQRAEYESEVLTGGKDRLNAWLVLNGLTYQIQHKGRTRGTRALEARIGRLADQSFDLTSKALTLIGA